MDASQWEELLVEAGLEASAASTHAITFARQKLSRNHLSIIDRDMLKELGVTALGESLSIIQLGKKTESSKPKHACKLPAKAPTLHAEMTPQQFRKFLVDWDVFCKMTDLPDDRVHAQLYSCADDAVQCALISTYTDFFDLPHDTLLQKVERVVTQRANPMVHRMTFTNITQSDHESIQNYVVRLRSAAEDCDFNCPECKKNISDTYIKDQFIRGLNNEMLQTDILAKAESLKTITETVKHAEAFESALRDQGKISDTVEVSGIRLSRHKRNKMLPPPDKCAPENTTGSRFTSNDPSKNRTFSKPCAGCGSKHTRPGLREDVCPAWGKRCAICKGMNHFARVCKSANAHYFHDESVNDAYASAFEFEDCDDDHIGALLAQIQFEDDNTYTDRRDPKDIEEIKIGVTPFVPIPDPREPDNVPPQNIKCSLSMFPDRGASICLCGTKHLTLLGLSNRHLINCNKTARCVGNFRITCHGWLPVKLELFGKTTKQALYVCEKVEKVYLSKKACKELGILSPSFPDPITSSLLTPLSETNLPTSNGQQGNVSYDTRA